MAHAPTTDHAAAHDAHGDHGHGDQPHAVPMSVLCTIFAILMVLTFATVAATWVDLGAINIYIALGIALVKAILVCLYFMHLRYDSPFNSIILVIALFMVTLFIAFTLIDSLSYAPNIGYSDAVTTAAAPAAPAAPTPAAH
ncbi:MAG: cytochrome C oxidase subunit IV family protein [Planctomycetota bacterium]|nr:cytochrome C oxidase subunit IV family protein [Planctomycetota bacterium]